MKSFEELIYSWKHGVTLTNAEKLSVYNYAKSEDFEVLTDKEINTIEKELISEFNILNNKWKNNSASKNDMEFMYNFAKSEYYNGEEIMSDAEFDKLEQDINLEDTFDYLNKDGNLEFNNSITLRNDGIECTTIWSKPSVELKFTDGSSERLYFDTKDDILNYLKKLNNHLSISEESIVDIFS